MDADTKDRLITVAFAADKTLDEFARMVMDCNLEDNELVQRIGSGLSLIKGALMETLVKDIVSDKIGDIAEKFDFDSLTPEDFSETRKEKDHKDVTDFDGGKGYL